MELYNLAERIKIQSKYKDIHEARRYDYNLRSTALIPFQKAGNRILNQCKEGYLVADIGPGTGIIPLYLAGKMPGVEIYCIENDRNLYEVAKDNLNLCIWAGLNPAIDIDLGNYTQLPFEDNSFDVVYSYNSIHMWEDPVSALKECKRICKKDGTIILEDFNRFSDEDFITFVLQMVDEGGEGFLEKIRSSYNQEEFKSLLIKAGIENWFIKEEDLSLIISSEA